MDMAKFVPTDEQFLAIDFQRRDAVERERMREHLACIGCGAPAYFVPPTKRGTCYFGARPHYENCTRATLTGTQTSGSLPETDERGMNESAFRLRPYRPRSRYTNVEHDPTRKPYDGVARRYSRARAGGRTTTGVDFLSLLIKLTDDPEFAESRKRIELPDGDAVLRDYCVNVTQVTDEHVNRKKLYWGTIHSAKLAKDGGAWLHTQWGAPNVLLVEDMLDLVMEDNEVEDIEEFAGASFLFLGYLNETREATHTYFRPRDPEWFALRLDPSRPEEN